MCYVDKDRYVDQGPAVMEEALNCTMNDHYGQMDRCRDNVIDKCKFIDCFYKEEGTVDPAKGGST